MPEKKNNHYIPKSILKYWVTKNEKNKKGVYVFDLKKNKSYFSEPFGRRAFSFAIENDIYVPVIEGKRRLELEEWFAGLENTLAITVKKIESDTNSTLFKSKKEMDKFILALFSFKHRTKYVVKNIEKYLKNNPKYLKLITGKKDNSSEVILLENIVNAINHDAIKLSRFEMIIMKSKENSFIYGDLPFLENIIDGYNFMPLTNKILIAFRSTKEKSFYKKYECENKMVESINFAIASNSENWIVADNLNQIIKYQSELKTKTDDETVYVPFNFALNGNYFK